MRSYRAERWYVVDCVRSADLAGRVDTFSTMDEFDIIQLRRNPEWRATLQVYHDLQQLRQQTPDSDGWVARQTEITGIDSAQLSSIHGKLIAFGMLKFDVGGRDVGVQYQLTQQGRRALLGEVANADDGSELAESA